MRVAWVLCGVLAVTVAVPVRAAFAHGDEAHPILFVNGSWFDGERFVRRDLYSVGGELRARHDGAVDDTVDLTGRFVVPSFADAHTHAFSDTAGFGRDARRFLAAGILFVKNPNNPASSVAAVRERVNRPQTVEVRFANGGLTSRGGHPAQIYENGDPQGHRWADDAYVAVSDLAELERKWPRVLAARPDFVKVYLESSEAHASRRDAPEFFGRRGLDPALLGPVVERAHRARLTVSCHVTSSADFHAAVAAGVDEISHLPLAPIADADAREAARRGIVVVTTTVSHRPADGVPDLDGLHRENLRRLVSAGARLALGTDHPTLTVVDEVERVRALGVLDDAALLRLLTYESAKVIFPERKLGPLAPGVEASFLVLAGDPLQDFSQLRRVDMRFKRGVRVEPPPAPDAKPSVAEAMMAPLMSGDLDGALALYHRLKRDEPGVHDFGEQALNQLGYAILRHGSAATAIAVFLKNAEAFPRSPNVYDSLADGYLAARDTIRAAAAYDRVLEVLAAEHGGRPEFRKQLETRAREQLARLRPAKD
jgi:hypothetical protein